MLIQLFTLKIIGYKCRFVGDKKNDMNEKEDKEKQRIIVELYWGKKGGGQLVCYDDATWTKFNNIIHQ